MPLRAALSAGEQRVLAEWTFERPGDLQGWQPNAALTNVVVTNGMLHCRALGADPILELRPLLDITTTPWDAVEIEMRADRDGAAELFWSNSSTGMFGGFSQEKTTRFNVIGDGQLRLYRLLPGWQTEGKIVRLRFDVFDGARFELDAFRVVRLTTTPPLAQANFDFRKSAGSWQPFDTCLLATGAMGNDATRSASHRPDLSLPPKFDSVQNGQFLTSPTRLLLSPPLDIDTATKNMASVRMAMDQGRYATLFFLTDSTRGMHSLTFPVIADGRERTYNVDLLLAALWRGRVLGLGLRPSDATNARVTLRSLEVGDSPKGPPQLELRALAVEEALPRAGKPTTLAALVQNTGGQTASNVGTRLTLPSGITLLSAPTPEAELASLQFGEETRVTWTIQSAQAQDAEIRIELAAAGAETVSASVPVRFTARPDMASADYVPEPQPVRPAGGMEVGAYYFPGWKSASQWEPLKRFPERKPVLGWYREGEPEVADWHIKWAVEHGVTFFAYDWYWSQGARQLEHALHEGYFKARYRHLLNFCLLWANHNPPSTSSHEDCLAVTRYWIEHYFRRPEYLVFDGKPLVIIFSVDRLRADLGDGVKRALDAMRETCRRAGLRGLYLAACVGDTGGARAAAAEGYDAVSAYNWPHLGMTGGGYFAPFETLVPAYRRHWEHLIAESPLPMAPLPVCGGWDSRPWHGEHNLVRFGRTPELFRRHLIDAKELLNTHSLSANLPRAVLVEAWNEWGEGSYIEPHSEFGFGYLDAIREVFTDAPRHHADVIPADVGLGPYDVPSPPPARTTWDFEADDEGWNTVMQMSEPRNAAGVLSVRTTGHDPAFFGPPMQARASEFPVVRVRMRLTRRAEGAAVDTAQLFWRMSRLPESESSSVRFAVQADGQWHEYHLPVSRNPRWRGVITSLRLDPGNQPDLDVDLDHVRLASSAPAQRDESDPKR